MFFRKPSIFYVLSIILLMISLADCTIKPVKEYQKAFQIIRTPLTKKLYNLESIYNEAYAIGLKTPYETDSEYLSRIDASWKYKGILYFAVGNGMADSVQPRLGAKLSYNPNDRTIDVVMESELVPVNNLFITGRKWSFGGQNTYSRAYPIYETSRTINTKPMQSIYGAIFDTAFTDVYTYMLDLMNAQYGIPMRLMASSDIAKDLIESKAVNFILGVELDSIANFHSEDSYVPPTATLTTAFGFSRKIARARLREVILCDTRTDEVLASYKLDYNESISQDAIPQDQYNRF